jgi:hypothetical protein
MHILTIRLSLMTVSMPPKLREWHYRAMAQTWPK